jgi:predicted homoserine dehydrogenase-like protein
VARAVLFGDATLTPASGPLVEVVTAAKTDLERGSTIDGLGGYATYGLAENAAAAAAERLLPIGLAEGCRLRRDVKRDDILRYDDVVVPEGRLADQLRAEQDRAF